MTLDGAHDAARQRVGAALRTLGHRFIGTTIDTPALAELGDDLERLASRLTGPARSRPVDKFRDEFVSPPDGAAFPDKIDRPYSGSASPLGCDLVIRRVGQEIEATTTLRSAHEGAPGRSHGGVVAAIFDDVFGFILQIEETAAFTGELAVRYEAGVPLHRMITFRVRLAERTGRKLFMTGDCWDGDRRLAISTATFIAPAAL